MKKYDKIILFDSYYPFEKGEPFLENEIEYLKNACNELIIIPTSVTNFSNSRLPNDISARIYTKTLVRNKFIRAVSAIAALLNKEVISELNSMFKKHQLSFRTIALLGMYSSEGRWKFKQVSHYLEKLIDKDDKVLFYSYWLDINAYLAKVFRSKYKNSKSVSRAHGFDIYLYRHPKSYFPLRNFIFEGLDSIYSISKDGQDYLNHSFPILNNTVELSYLGTKDYGLNPNTLSASYEIVSCSNLIPLKRVHLIIEALSSITEIPINWTHFGDGIEKNKLINLAKKSLPTNINWNFVGSVSNQELLDLYKTKHYDLFLNVSESEGIPVSIMEAMSFGIPVIATDVGGTKELVENGTGGYLLNKNFNSKELASLILYYTNTDIIEKNTKRKEARQLWEENFEASKNYTFFYDQL